MNNEPVAWMLADKEAEHIRSIMAVQHDFVPEGCIEIPLYTHPAKELDEQFKKGFEAGKVEGWKAHKFHHLAKTLTDEEIVSCIDESEPDTTDMIRFARAILKKASEK